MSFLNVNGDIRTTGKNLNCSFIEKKTFTAATPANPVNFENIPPFTNYKISGYYTFNDTSGGSANNTMAIQVGSQGTLIVSSTYSKYYFTTSGISNVTQDRIALNNQGNSAFVPRAMGEVYITAEKTGSASTGKYFFMSTMWNGENASTGIFNTLSGAVTPIAPPGSTGTQIDIISFLPGGTNNTMSGVLKLYGFN